MSASSVQPGPTIALGRVWAWVAVVVALGVTIFYVRVVPVWAVTPGLARPVFADSDQTEWKTQRQESPGFASVSENDSRDLWRASVRSELELRALVNRFIDAVDRADLDTIRACTAAPMDERRGELEWSLRRLRAAWLLRREALGRFGLAAEGLFETDAARAARVAHIAAAYDTGELRLGQLAGSVAPSRTMTVANDLAALPVLPLILTERGWRIDTLALRGTALLPADTATDLVGRNGAYAASADGDEAHTRAIVYLITAIRAGRCNTIAQLRSLTVPLSPLVD